MPTLPITDIEKKAWNFAKQKHEGMFRKFQSASYFDGHVAKVFGLVKQYDTRDFMGVAALLHDTIEDTDTTFEEIQSIFGKRIARIVKELTSNDDDVKFYGKMNYLSEKMVDMSSDALTIKLCDRLQNISDSYNASERFRVNYYKETRHIINVLREDRRYLNRKQERIIQQIEGLLSTIKGRYEYESLRENTQFDILSDDVKKLLPGLLELYTSNGSYKMKKDAITRETDVLRVCYIHNTMMDDYNGDDAVDGEPDILEFDMHFMRSGAGLKIAIDITYGDSMMSEFTIQTPNKVTVGHYNGIGSTADPDTAFGFTDKSLGDLCKFFNNFGFKLSPKDFTFIDKDPNSYVREDVKLTPLSHGEVIMVVNNDKDPNTYLKKLLEILKMRGIEHVVVTTTQDVENCVKNKKVIGSILTGSSHRINDVESDASKKVLEVLDCPILGICYGFKLMSKQSGSKIKDTGKHNLTHTKLTKYDEMHPLFKDIDLKNIDFSFDFNDRVINCPDGFKEIGKVGEYIVAVADDSKKRYGVLFHPENVERTWQIIDNFTSMLHSSQSDIENLKVGKFQENMKYLKRFEDF